MATPKILLADSDPALLQNLALHLRNDDYEVICADDGEGALRVARYQRPDVLVVNVGLNVGERHTLHEYLSADPELLAFPVIYLVAERPSPGTTLPKLPESSMIRKPVPTGELLRKVAGALGAADQQRDAA
jgi:two-component system alkaline phosphatase synthesis response regulator PhoP